ncbi:MAG: hypothetical protein GY725_11055 [bacterium]|nr:hypothetical protein [bacterium]
MKWIAALGLALIVLVAAVVLAGPSLLFRYPDLIGTLSEFRDPIGAHHDVAWGQGPAISNEFASDCPPSRPPNIVVILVDDRTLIAAG